MKVNGVEITSEDVADIDTGLNLYAQSLLRQVNKYAVGSALHSNFKAEYDRIPLVRSKVSTAFKEAK